MKKLLIPLLILSLIPSLSFGIGSPPSMSRGGSGGTGDIDAVWLTTSGTVDALTAGAGDSLNATNADFTIPNVIETDCSAVVAEGRTCWDSDDDTYWIGDGASALQIGGGTVDTSGVPVANDYARFTDADTISGRSYSEVRDDLSLATTDDVTFASLNTGQGAYELYAMNQDVESTDSPEWSSVIYTDQDASPNTAGELQYDNTFTGLDDGGFVWYDDDEIQLLIGLDSSEVLESGDDGHVVTFNWNGGAGYFDLQAGGGAGGDSWGDPVDAHILPTGADNTYDLGSGAASFKDGYFDGAVDVATLNTGQGDNELYAMNQDVETTDDVTYNSVTATNGITVGRSATPQDNYQDSNCTDSDDNVRTYVNCTDTGSGTEDCDYTIAQQIAGTLTDILTFDADGVLTSVKDFFISLADPDLVFDDTDGADGIISVDANDADDAVMIVGVDDSTGDDTPYLELDGVNERVEVKEPLLPEAGIDNKVKRNNASVDDDDCTGEQGSWWYDTTDSRFEFCNANSGTPTELGGGSASIEDDVYSSGWNADTTNGASQNALYDYLHQIDTDDDGDCDNVGPDAIDEANIADDGIDSEHYNDGSIDTAHIAADQITNALIADDQIDSEHYVDGSIDEAHLNIANAPTDEYVLTYESDTSNFQWVELTGGGDITEVGECSTGACTSDFINGTDVVDDAIDSEHYVDASIDAAHLASDVIDETKIADDGIDSEHYNDGSIDRVHLASDAARVTTNSKSANYTIGTDDAKECYGGVIYVTSTCDITACDNLADGMSFSVITIGATQVDVDVQSDDRMYLDGTALDDGDKASNTSTTGDSIVCTYESAAGWYCMSGSPDGDNWTDGGA